MFPQDCDALDRFHGFPTLPCSAPWHHWGGFELREVLSSITGRKIQVREMPLATHVGRAMRVLTGLSPLYIARRATNPKAYERLLWRERPCCLPRQRSSSRAASPSPGFRPGGAGLRFACCLQR
jgi:hypothetical protein